jgi:hypothetical protein
MPCTSAQDCTSGFCVTIECVNGGAVHTLCAGAPCGAFGCPGGEECVDVGGESRCVESCNVCPC